MAYIDFLNTVHSSTKRDYIGRVLSGNKADFATIAKRYDIDYWDGNRNTGYGGYRYDGRWFNVAMQITKHYRLDKGARILDIGCGKGFLLYEFSRIIEEADIFGIDISSYAIENSLDKVKPKLKRANATALPFPDKYFDLVISINTLHNLRLPDLDTALKEIERVSNNAKYIVVDGYRNEQEKVNLLYWQLTCECFYTPEEWEWLFTKIKYTGDYSCVYFD